MAGPLSPEAEALAASDPTMAALVDRFGARSITERIRGGSHFSDLARIIVGQQVSTAAAATVWSRVCDSYGGEAPAAEQVIGAEDVLRGCGLSGRKASYVVGIGEAIVAGELEPEALADASDDDVIAQLTALRGLGQWSAEMFLMFNLGRPDVFSGGDLGLRRGIQVAFEMEQPPSPDESIGIAERWRPNRTLACIYLWEAARAAR